MVFSKGRLAVAERFEGIKRLLEAAVHAVAPPAEVRARPRGKDFMRDDLTYGADYAKH
jgi:hypothetical protein